MGSIGGYEFSFNIDGETLVLPITPGEVRIKSTSNNKTVTLINGGEINLLKSPALMEIEFEARFPMREYPYSRWSKRGTLGKNTMLRSRTSKLWDSKSDFAHYFDKFTSAKQDKKPVNFTIVRFVGDKVTWLTGFRENNLYSIETLETKESAEEGDDVLVTFKLKQYKPYGVIKANIKTDTPTTTSTSNTTRTTDDKPTATEPYVVKKGDTLWAIAKKFYGDGSKWTKIYEANKKVIEDTANKYRNGKGSSNGHWIYPGTKLVIPGQTSVSAVESKPTDSKPPDSKPPVETKKYTLTIEHVKDGCSCIDLQVNYTIDGKSKKEFVYNDKPTAVLDNKRTYNFDSGTTVTVIARDVLEDGSPKYIAYGMNRSGWTNEPTSGRSNGVITTTYTEKNAKRNLDIKIRWLAPPTVG